MRSRFLFALAAAALVGCGGPFTTDDSNVATTDGGTGSTGTPPPPQVTFVTPPDHHEFEFENEDDEHHGDDEFEIEVRVERANLAEPGRCSGSAPCGHLVLLIDGVACGNPNSSSTSAKFKGKFGKCVKVSGQHQIVVQLVDDRGNVLASTAPITVDVKLKGRHADNTASPGAGDDHHDGDDEDDDHGGNPGPSGGGDDDASATIER
jgi:hypothetical protein